MGNLCGLWTLSLRKNMSDSVGPHSVHVNFNVPHEAFKERWHQPRMSSSNLEIGGNLAAANLSIHAWARSAASSELVGDQRRISDCSEKVIMMKKWIVCVYDLCGVWWIHIVGSCTGVINTGSRFASFWQEVRLTERQNLLIGDLDSPPRKYKSHAEVYLRSKTVF